MGSNPFDKFLPVPPLEVVKASNLARVREGDRLRAEHRAEWEAYNEEEHVLRWQDALEHEDAEGRFIPTALQAKWDVEDDIRFPRLTHFDELLELQGHEDYLRGRRAWERRHRVEEEEEAEVKSSSGHSTAQGVWMFLLGVFLFLTLLSATLYDWKALGLVVILVPIWLVLARFPLYYTGSSSTGGTTRGISGSAV